LGLGQDLPVDQAFQLGADAFGVLGFGADAQREAYIFRAHARPVRGEHGQDLLVGLADDGRLGSGHLVVGEVGAAGPARGVD
jgi:hypothetical protein